MILQFIFILDPYIWTHRRFELKGKRRVFPPGFLFGLKTSFPYFRPSEMSISPLPCAWVVSQHREVLADAG